MPQLAASCMFSSLLVAATGVVPTTQADDAPTRQAIRIVLHDQAPVTGPLVTLADLGRIEGVGERVAAIGAVVVGRAPLAGRSRGISRGYVKMRLRAAGLPLDDVEFGGAEEVLVSTPAALRACGGDGPTARADRGELSDPGGRSEPTGSRRLVPPRAEEALVVSRGQPLVIRARYGLVEVRAEAKAQEAGRVGDVVPVQLSTGGSRILVRITGPGLAEVMR